MKDDIFVKTISLTSADSILYIDSLLPNRTYNLSSTIQSTNASISNNAIPVTTMDTTSHDFAFQTWTFGGQAGSCTLHDVAIIEENDIWAVGEIYIADTSTSGYTLYNAIQWNGYEWALKRILYNNNIWDITTIYSFDQNDIWFSAFVRFDGQNFIEMAIPEVLTGWGINKLWGTSSNDIYVVGNNGNIAHYDGQSWTKIESGTELNINDIWGYTDNLGNKLILCAASDLGTNHQRKLLRINDNSVDTLDWSPQKTLYTLWFPSIHKIYAGGGKTYARCESDWVEQTAVNFFTYGIRGNDYNDVYAVGGGHFSHFNGYRWKEIPELFLTGGNYEGLATKGSITCSVGYLGNQAMVAIITK